MAGSAQALTLDQLVAALGVQGRALAALPLERPLQTVAVLLAAEARRCFDESRDPDGVPWLPLKSPSRRRGGPSARPLRDTGALMASVTGRAVQAGGGWAVVFGTNVAYASYHQLGTRTVPARPFLGISERALVKIRQVLAGAVAQALAPGGRQGA